MSEGNGSYTVRVLEQVQGNQYAVKFSQDLSVSLCGPVCTVLISNQYVNFTADSSVVKEGRRGGRVFCGCAGCCLVRLQLCGHQHYI